MNKGKSRAIRAALWVLAVCVVAPSAHAEGAIAIGIRNNDASLGLAAGWAVDQITTGEAKYRALANCLRQENSTPDVLAQCKVVAFRNQCLVFAADKADGTPGWGWGVHANPAQAETTALDKCRATAGAARVQFCEVVGRACDTKQVVAEGERSPQVSLPLPAAAEAKSEGFSRR